MSDPQHDWSEFDDSLDDGAVDREVPPAAKPWLAGQRFVHGLLRQMHNRDAQAREARVQDIMTRLSRSAEARPSLWLVTAAALLLALSAFWLWHGDAPMPSAEAAVARAASLLGQDVDRRFTLAVHEHKGDADGRQIAAFELTTRPGMHFLLDGHFEALERKVPVRIGCDGSEIWMKMPGTTLAQPLDRAAMLLAMAGDVLDLGYLDIQALLQRLPQGFELACVGTETGSNGHRLLRIRATQLPDRIQERVHALTLTCDDDTGMVTRIEIDTTPRGRNPRASVVQYVGTVELGPGGYKKP